MLKNLDQIGFAAEAQDRGRVALLEDADDGFARPTPAARA